MEVLRSLYIRLEAETMLRYAGAGILKGVEEERSELSLAAGKASAQMLGVTTPKEAFKKPAAIVDCASWKILANEKSFTAVCVGCKLAAMCKELNTPSPCRMYCLNPIEGMVKAVEAEARFKVESTLMSEKNCTVKVTW
jgi:hypothetical protein